MSVPSPSPSALRLRRVALCPTRRAWAHLGIGGALYLAGANVAASWVLLLAALTIGAVPWAALTAWRLAGRLVVTRELPGRAVEGQGLPVSLGIAGSAASTIVVRDHLTGTCAAAQPGQTLSGSTKLQRGILRTGLVEATVWDPLGLVAVRTSGDVPGAVTVVPRRLRSRPVGPVLRAGTDGVPSRRAPAGETIGVRDHVSGEPLRNVHWRSSARRGALVVRERADAAAAPLDVAIAGGSWPCRTLDRAATLASTTAESETAAGRRVTIAADGSAVNWGSRAEELLAGLPPHAGAAPRPLDAPPPPAGTSRLELSAADGGVALHLDHQGDRRYIGTLADDDPDPAGWLSERMGRALP